MSLARQNASSLGGRNRRIGWTSLALCVGTGLVMGLWSFSGPLPVPDWIGDYDALARRFLRLGHIAFFGIGLLNLMLARELPRLALSGKARRWAAHFMNAANIWLPLGLFAAATYEPLKYLLPLPALSAFAALSIVAWGVWTDKGELA